MADEHPGLGRVLDAAVTIVSFGTNKLIGRATGWLQRNGLVRLILPALIVNEGFGAYRVYVAGGAFGWW